MRTQWAISAEYTHDAVHWAPYRLVYAGYHPLLWAEEHSTKYRVTVRLLQWERVSTDVAARLRRVLGNYE